MKAIIRMISVLSTLCLTLASSMTCFAAERSSYTYTVTFSAGDQGVLSIADGRSISVTGGGDYQISLSEDGRTVKITGLTLANQVNFQNSAVILEEDSKYYVRGVRRSGWDNNTVALASFPVECDQDYVVAYGIKGDLTQYTVNYVDANGNVLYPQQVYYGNVGDRPVLAYLYIDGYQPQAYNLTRTLQKDSSKNIFDFVYRPVPAAGGGGGGTTPGAAEVPGGTVTPGGIVTIPGGTVTPSGGGIAPGGAAAPGGNAGVPGGEAGVPGGDVQTPEEEGTTNLPEENLPLTDPEELVNLDDEEVPLADFDNNQGSDGTVAGTNRRLFRYTWMAAGIGLLALIAAVSGLYVYRRMRKGRKARGESEDENNL